MVGVLSNSKIKAESFLADEPGESVNEHLLAKDVHSKSADWIVLCDWAPKKAERWPGRKRNLVLLSSLPLFLLPCFPSFHKGHSL